MQHPEGPTWCKDCGRFDFACEGIECSAPGAGAFDKTTEEGFQNIADCLDPCGLAHRLAERPAR